MSNSIEISERRKNTERRDNSVDRRKLPRDNDSQRRKPQDRRQATA